MVMTRFPTGGNVNSGFEIVTSSTGNTEWIQFTQGQVCIAISGPATAVTAVVERSSTPSGSNIAPADTAGFTGNPSTGIVPNIYTEPGTGWWRVRLTALTGASVTVSFSGPILKSASTAS